MGRGLPCVSPNDPPASPNVAETLGLLQQGHGRFLFLAAEERSIRARRLREIASESRSQGFEHIALRAHPLDSCAPFGALLPWLVQWYTPPTSKVSAAAAVDNGPRAPLGSSFSIALAGLILPESTSPGLPASPLAQAGAKPNSKEAPARSLSPEDVRAELLELVQGRTRQRPAVVSIEDADHLDASSREWLSFLGRRLNDLPLLMLLAVDPFAETFEDWRTELAHAPCAWDRSPPLSGRAPRAPTLSERLRPLPPRTTELLSVVVLAGPDAEEGLVREVLGWKEDEVALAASPAIDAGLMARTSGTMESLDPGLYPDLAGTLTKSRVTGSHRAIARALEMRHPRAQGALLFRLSEHWAEGGEVGSGVAALSSASLEAERWGSPEIAEGRLRRALALAQSEPTARGRELEEKAYAQLATARARAGDPKGSRDAFGRALQIAQQRGGKPLQWGKYVSGWADAETRLGGDPEERLKATYEQVKGRSNELEASLLRSLGFYYVERGRPDLGVEVSERACALAERGSDIVLTVRAHQTAMNAYLFGGDSPEKARAHVQKALEYRSELEGTADAGFLAVLIDGLSNVECAIGNERAAVQRGEEALAAARQFGHRSALLLVLGNLAEHCAEAGDLRRAQELSDELGRICDHLGLPEKDTSRQQKLLLEGRISMAAGDHETARKKLEHLAESSERGGGRYFLGQALVHLTVLSVERGDLETAHRHLRRLEREGVRKTLVGQNRRILDRAVEKMQTNSSSRRP